MMRRPVTHHSRNPDVGRRRVSPASVGEQVVALEGDAVVHLPGSATAGGVEVETRGHHAHGAMHLRLPVLVRALVLAVAVGPFDESGDAVGRAVDLDEPVLLRVAEAIFHAPGMEYLAAARPVDVDVLRSLHAGGVVPEDLDAFQLVAIAVEADADPGDEA